MSEPAGDCPGRAAESSAPPARLKRRPDFLAVARGVRVHDAAFSLQARRRAKAETSDNAPDVPPGARIGFTVTKKTGGAVERNRIRRRLREALRHAKALSTEPDSDYVVVARREALSIPFARLTADLERAVRRAGTQMNRPRTSGKDVRRQAP